MIHVTYRPDHWNQVIGNGETVSYLSKEVENPGRPHTYIFTGPFGCGKTTLARIFARELGCKGSDLSEIDVGDYRGIDSAREIRQTSAIGPMMSPCRVWILDECHKLTSDAQSALLKVLEDTPSYAYFLLATNEPTKLLKTVLSRCTPCPVRTLTEEEMRRLLFRAARSAKVTLPDEVVYSIMDVANGIPRTALITLEKYLTDPTSPITGVTENTKEIIDLCRALLTKQPWSGVAKILQGLKNEDAEDIRRAVLGYATSVLLKGKENAQALVLLDVFREPFYNVGFPGVVWASSICVQKV